MAMPRAAATDMDMGMVTDMGMGLPGVMPDGWVPRWC